MEPGDARAAELELAAACLRGEPTALAQLEAGFIAPAASALARHGFSPTVIAEATQIARLRLVIQSEQGAPPALLGYTGVGPLGRFVEVVVAHAAAGISRGRRDVPLDDPGEDALLTHLGIHDVEAMLSRAHERAVVRSAVQRALASLTPRERALLRFHLLDRRTHDQIGAVYGVTRVTVARWLSQAIAKLTDRARTAVAQALGQEGVSELLLGEIDLSLSRILGGA